VSTAVCKIQQMTSHTVPMKLTTFYRILYNATLL